MGPAGIGEREDVPTAAAVAEMFMALLEHTHLSAPGDIARVVAHDASIAGATDTVMYLVDYEQHELVPLPVAPGASLVADRLAVQGTVAGRCFTATEVMDVTCDEPGRRRLWLPLLDGTDRLGVLTLTVTAVDDVVPEQALAVWERLAHLVAQLVVSKSLYGDTFERFRRSQPMSIAAELQTALLPPTTFATQGLVVSAIREPCYAGGGDAYDYAVNEDVAHVAIIDAMGHGLAASGAAAFTLAAYRRARRMACDLASTYTSVDAALAEQYAAERYATALFAELHLASGRLSWVAAGHPHALLLRGGRLVKTLASEPATPLGVTFSAESDVEIGVEQLEPGDRLLMYTDGLPDARQPDGTFFGLDRLVDFVERAAQDGFPAPETLRRLRHAVLQHQHGTLQDDATAVLVEWRGGTEQALLPRTVSPDLP